MCRNFEEALTLQKQSLKEASIHFLVKKKNAIFLFYLPSFLPPFLPVSSEESQRRKHHEEEEN